MPDDVTLGQLLRARKGSRSYAKYAEDIGISRSWLHALANEKNKQAPELETLAKIARYFDLPLDTVVSMAGVDMEPLTADDLTLRFAAEIAADPDLREILERARRLYPRDRRALLAFLDAQLRADAL